MSMNPTPKINIPPTCTSWIDDILMEILLRLPPKPLIRFKLVSKHWLSLISSHQFSQLHTLRHPKSKPGLLLTTSSSQHHFIYFCHSKNLIPHNFPSSFIRPKILSSSNGLVLLQCDDIEKDYYIYNPTTRQSRKIPVSHNALILSMNLAFDPSISPYYKIICVKSTSQKSIYERCCHIEIYYSDSHTWKLCLESLTVSVHVYFPYGVHLKNVMYWGNCPHASLYYDIEKNETGGLPDFQIPWPPPVGRVRGGALYAQVQESNGRLYRPVRERSIALFELEEDRSQWLLKYHDVIDSGLHRGLNILCFLKEDGEEEGTGIVLFQFPDKIMGYRFLDKSFEELVDLKNEDVLVEEAGRGGRDGPFGYSGVHHF